MEASAQLLDFLSKRALPDGGFPPGNPTPGSIAEPEGSRPDSTAWAVLGLSVAGVEAARVARARAWLADRQREDGCISVSRESPEADWPTALAALAWHGCAEHREQRARAVAYLLETGGDAVPNPPDSPVGHDKTLRGWPWIAGTHSWIEPTATAFMVLRLTGQGEHERAVEAQRLLMDRQLPNGGWNYGNKVSFGRELLPLAQSTGVALCALQDSVGERRVRASIAYLKNTVADLRTPLSLGWAILGLAAWGERPASADERIAECFARRKRYGGYNTENLGLLALAWFARQGLLRGLATEEPPP